MLTLLLLDPKSVPKEESPVSAWVQKYAKGRYAHLQVPPRYGIADIDLCRIQNWYYHHIPGAKNDTKTWMLFNYVPIYHVCTLLIAFRLMFQPSTDKQIPSTQQSSTDRRQELIKKAWELQCSPDNSNTDDQDVDIEGEAIRDLETLFGYDSRPEWSSDVTHQDGWDPYTEYHRHIMGDHSEKQVMDSKQTKVCVN